MHVGWSRRCCWNNLSHIIRPLELWASHQGFRLPLSLTRELFSVQLGWGCCAFYLSEEYILVYTLV